MGAVADTVSGVLGTDGGGGGLLGAAGDIIESVGDIAEDVVREVGSAVESVGREAGKIGQAAINDPVGTIAKVAAIATQQYWALPLISAATVVANGGDLGSAALAAGISYAGMGIASGITDYLAGPAFDSLSSMAVQDAVDLAAQGLAPAQISEIIGQSYSLSSNIAGSIAQAAASGVPAATMATAYAGAFGEQLNGVMTTASMKILQGAAGNGVANAAMTIARGGDPTQALISSLTGAAGTVVGGNANIGLRELGANAAISNVLSATAGAATKGLLSGQDFTTATGSALINNIINTTLSESGKAIKNSEFAQGVKNQWNSLIDGAKGSLDSAFETAKAENSKLLELSKQNEDILSNAKSIQDEAEGYKANTLTPAQQVAEEAYKTAMSSYDEYKSVTDKFGDLVSQYDAAKAAGNIALANELADQANALIPEINTKTASYNDDFNTYDAAKNDFTAKNDVFTGYATKLTDLNTKYLEVNNQTNTQAEAAQNATKTFEDIKSEFENNVKQVLTDTTAAQEKVSDYTKDSQKAFERAFASGQTALEAADFAGALNSQSATSQKAFNQAFDQGLNVQDALALSQQINEMPKTAQNYYDFATSFGLKPTDAAGIVTDVSGMSNIAQQVFFDNLAQKYDTEAALSAAQDVNSLNTAQQSTYFNAKLNGLNPELAMNAAKEVGGLTKAQQDTYINNLRNNVDPNTAKFLAALQTDKTAAVNQNEVNLAKLTTPEQRDAYNISVASGLSPTKALESVLDLFVSEAQAGAGSLPPTTPEVDPSKIKEAVYHQDPATGRWGIYIKDSQGNLKDTGVVLSTGGTFTSAQEGKLTGDKFIVDESATENGVPALSMTPYTGATSTNNQGNATEISKVDNPDGKTYTVTYSDNTKEVYEKGTDLPVNQPAPVDNTPAVNPVLQDYIDKLFTGATPTRTIATTQPAAPGTGTTGTTGGATTGTATDTTGTGGTTGTTGGSATTGGTTTGGATTGGTGTGAAGGTGTGAGTGTGTGTGTGGGGGGGTGGVGAGVGAATAGFGYSGWQALQSQDQYGGIKNLTPGLTQRTDYSLSGLPTDTDEDTVNPMSDIPKFATGSSTSSNTYDPYSTKDVSGSGISGSLTPGLSKAQINYILTGLPGAPQGRAEGGSIEEHNPSFFSEGGLGSIENRYVQGEGDGTSDSIAAMLANGEFVIPADVVSKLGNGSNEAGAGVLDQFLVEIRKHAHSNGEKLPPESKGPLGYLLDAKRKVKA